MQGIFPPPPNEAMDFHALVASLSKKNRSKEVQEIFVKNKEAIPSLALHMGFQRTSFAYLEWALVGMFT